MTDSDPLPDDFRLRKSGVLCTPAGSPPRLRMEGCGRIECTLLGPICLEGLDNVSWSEVERPARRRASMRPGAPDRNSERDDGPVDTFLKSSARVRYPEFVEPLRRCVNFGMLDGEDDGGGEDWGDRGSLLPSSNREEESYRCVTCIGLE
jgi:hypothetical protein